MPNPKDKPLAGRTVAVTRSTEQAGKLVRKLRAQGANVLELPLIKTLRDVDLKRRDEIFKELWTYEWIVFTSANGVRYFFEAFFEKFDDIRALGGLRIAAVGPATATAIRELRLRVDLIPELATAEGLSKAMEHEESLDNLKVLLITGNRNREVLSERLEAAMAIVDSLQVYRTDKMDLTSEPGAEAFRKDGADAIVFASSSAVESFVDQAAALQMAPDAKRPAGCSIGPITSEAMKRLGVPVNVIAKEPSLDSVVEALITYFESSRP